MTRPSDTVPGVAVFDVCDTLYATNTTVGFLEFFADRYRRQGVQRSLSRWTSRRSFFFWAGALAYRLLHRDVGRRRLVAALKGERRATLEAAARAYVQETLPNLVNVPLHDRLARHLGQGDRVILLSSSLDLVIAAIADAVGTEFRGSTLGFVDDVCTGRIEHDLTGRKVEALASLAGTRSGPLAVYTDNRSDLALLRLADHPNIVFPANQPWRRWGDDQWNMIKL